MTVVRTIGDLIEAAGAGRRLVLVGIGGRGAAGKSTLAARLAGAFPGVQIVATDVFFDGNQFDLQRLRTDVVDELVAGRSATYEPWDWAEGAPSGTTVSVEPNGVVVIEGVCALHEMFRHDVAVRVWVDAPTDVRLDRAVARDGESSRSTWTEIWMPNEDAYIAGDRPVECADVVVDGTRPLD